MRLAPLFLLSLSALTFACTTTSGGAADGDDDDDTAETSSSSSGGSDHGGSSGGSGTTSSSSGGPLATDAEPLSPTTFVFERDMGNYKDQLVAMDYVTGDSRVVTTLEEGGLSGWSIDGAAISPDRKHIALASPFGAVAADVATGKSVNIIWLLDVNGENFVRLTPTFKSESAQIDVRNPIFTPDGTQVVYDYGEGNGSGGYVAPWAVSTAGGSVPSAVDLPLNEGCSVNAGIAFEPTTGNMLAEHTVCMDDDVGGYYLYPASGGAAQYLVDDKGVSIAGSKPSFSPDGTLFVYAARIDATQVQSLFAYLADQKKVVELIPGASGRDIVGGVLAPDNKHLVYCVREGGATDLHVTDLTANPPSDTQLTHDGRSCGAVF